MIKSRATLATCLLCALVFGLEMSMGGGLFNTSGDTLLNLGASSGPLTIAQAQYSRLISSIFLHAYLLHLVLNIYVLIDFGPMAESSLGRNLFIVIFFFSGIIGALTSILYNPTQTSVGASAAILGLLGALIYKSWFEKGNARFSRPQLVMLCVFLLYSLLLGITSNVIDNAAHLGGFFAGVLACAAYFGTKPENAITKRRGMLATAGLAALIPTLIFVDNRRVVNNPDVTAFEYSTKAADCVKNKDYKQAMVNLNAAQEASTNKVSPILYKKAEVLEKLDQDNAALGDLEVWLQQNKNDVQALLLKSVIMHKLTKDDQAVACVTQALAVKPTTLMDYFTGALQPNGGQALLYNNRAWYKLAMGQVKDALSDCDKSLAIEPKSATTYDTRGVAFLMLKDYSQAKNDFNRSLTLNAARRKNSSSATTDGAGYYHRAIAEKSLGDEQAFKQDMERYKALDYKPEAWEPKP